ncbi:MAG: hypothetical protein RL291_1265 [Pseudomonadota bacterium]
MIAIRRGRLGACVSSRAVGVLVLLSTSSAALAQQSGQPNPSSPNESSTPSIVTPDHRSMAEGGQAREIADRFQASWRLLVWPAGSTVSGCFMDQSDPANQSLRAAIVQAGDAWSAIANLKFDFGSAPDYRSCDVTQPSDIRVSFVSSFVSRSAIGTRALDLRPGVPTMTIHTSTFGVAVTKAPQARLDLFIHEFGHALGLPHEHQHPASPCAEELAFPALCPGEYERGKPNDPHSMRINARVNLFAAQRAPILDPDPARLVPYDVRSVMHYRFPSTALKGGTNSACFTSESRTLSDGDRAKMEILYPADPEAQRRMLRGELKALARALAHHGVSEETAHQIRRLVATRLARRFPDVDGLMDFSGLAFPRASPETRAIEARLANPSAFLPAACPR